MSNHIGQNIAQGLESFLTNQPLVGIQERDEVRNLLSNIQEQSQVPGFNVSQSPEFRRLQTISPQQASAIQDARFKSIIQTLDIDEAKGERLFKDAATALALFKSSPQRSADFLRNRSMVIISEGGNPSDTMEIIDLIDQGRDEEAKNLLESTVEGGRSIGVLTATDKNLSTAQKEFKSLTKGFSPEQEMQARLIKLGLSPRAVGSAVQTISQKGIADQIGDVKSIIKQREKFGELTALSRAKAIDKGIDRLAKMDVGMNNIDRAIAQLNAGAGVGAIQKFLPSFKAASVALDNIQNSMALDVIGSVTFGALSEGELNLAKEVALPTGLDTQQLIQHLQDRKDSQNKLRAYFNDQIQFLDKGGTVAGFLREQERIKIAQQQPGLQTTPQIGTGTGTGTGVLTPEEEAELRQLEQQFGGQ